MRIGARLGVAFSVMVLLVFVLVVFGQDKLSDVQQITEVVQQTSRGAQESATAAVQLHGNAEELQRLVRQFRL